MKTADFDVLVTFDQNLPYQQNIPLPVSVIVLCAQDNRVATALAFSELILSALETCKVGDVIRLKLEPRNGS